MRRWIVGLIGMTIVSTSGCAVTIAKRSPWDIQQLAQLSDELEQFKTLARLKVEETDQLRRAKELLEQQLSSAEASVGYDARGLVTRVREQVLFDSGKARLRRGASAILDKVAAVLKDVPDQPVGIEGHTDTVPITHSGWSDNKALSIARANAVVDYLVQAHGMDRTRLTPVGYGEERPIASNDTAEGRQQNRRVELILLPQASGPSYKSQAQRASQEAATGSVK